MLFRIYYGKAETAVDMKIGDTVKLTVDVPQDGQYCMLFDYISYDESILPIEMAMQVDGEYPFFECRTLEFETTWAPDEEPAYDRYDNQLVTVPNKRVQWEQKYLSDSSYRHSDPLVLELTKGTHELSFEIKEGTFLLGNIALTAPTEIAAYTGSEVAEGNALYEIEGEGYSYTNDSAIHAVDRKSVV